VLAGEAPAAPSGNLLLDDLMGATLHWAGTHDWAELAAATDEVTARLRRIGRRVFTMPVGGSVPHGSAAFVAAYLELVVQCTEYGLTPSAVVHASSSAGTQAGLHLGAVLAGALLGGELLDGTAPPVIGVDVAKITDPLAEEVARLAAETAVLLGVAQIWDAAGPGQAPTVLEGYLGPGYALPSGGSTAALHLLARTEGVILDPVYSAKGFHAVCESDLPGPIVFWHTGGTPALFA
jgi:1-aminocyclopropane-1-carboxylate deaminase/D-cysteine desulfhydrase-like pyridoxal-dependent ACC family enzyme